MPHGMLDPYFQLATGRKLKAIRNWLYWRLIEHKVVSQADGLLFTCKTEMLLAREPFKPYRPKREIDVGYGIETPPVYTTTMRQSFLERCPAVANRPFILFISRIHPKKGIDILLKAYLTQSKKAKASNQDMPVLVIAGPGLESNFGQAMLQLACQDADTSSSIFFPGMLAGDAKWGAFYGCEAFILPSHQENFGIAVVEALACSKPVLISNQVNIWREIEEGGGGITAYDTLTGTEHLLHQWLELGAEDKKVMGSKAYATFERQFAVEPSALRFKEAISYK
jgi:glycosyltransferase involved in cell wall biosynthesis